MIKKNSDITNGLHDHLIHGETFNIPNKRLEEINELLRKSLIEKLPLTIIYCKNDKTIKLRGIIQSFHPIDKELLLKDKNQNPKTLLLKHIVDVQE